ncbi:MAG: arginase family protein [Candidatus Heimdallarchaeota archaeon]|nr:arginase family protein [Candidatus Heimdallarchaeota archaeon]MCK4770441.1 arginase family protein [Candidatus Heimdallarchaeota archaeon]
MKDTFIGFYKKKSVRDINEKKSILLFGLPLDRVKATPGRSKKAPKAIRKHSYEFSGVSMEYDIMKSKRAYYDLGDFWESNKIAEVWKKAYDLDSKILALGGDHSITFDILSNSEIDDRTAIIWLDSHADLADEYPKGIFKSHGTVFTNLKNLKKLKADQLFLIGGHAFTQTSTEHNKIKNNEVNFLPTQKIMKSREESYKIIREFIERYDRVYLSIDIDVLDQSFVPTLGTSEPFGLTPQILLEILEIIVPNAMYVDIVETQYRRSNKIVLDFVVGLIFQILQIWETI